MRGPRRGTRAYRPFSHRRRTLVGVVISLTVLAVAGVLGASAGAASCDTWVGPTTGGDWGTAANWTGGVLPGSGSIACWATGTSILVATADVGDTADSLQGDGLEIQSGATLTLTGSDASTLGSLNLDSGGELDGAAGQTLAVSGTFAWGNGGTGNTTLNNTVTLAGADMAVTAGAVTMDNTSTFMLDGGSVSTSSPVTLGASLTVASGTAFSTTSTMAPNSTVTGSGATFTAAGLSGTGSFGVGTNALVLDGGTTTLASGDILSSGSLTISDGTLDAGSGSSVSPSSTTISGGELEDAGTLGGTSTTISGGILLDTGSVSGSVSVTSGTLDGTGTVSGSVDNTGGTVSPGDAPGTLTVGTTYTQGSGATLAIEIDSSTSFSQLAVSGSATLAGTLDLTGTPTLASSDSFEVLTYASHTGTFTTVTGSNSGSYLADYGATNLTLTYFVPPAYCPSNSDVFYPAGGASSGEWNGSADSGAGGAGGTWLPSTPTSTSIACWAAGTTVTLGPGDDQTVKEIQGGSLNIDGGGLTINTTDASALSGATSPTPIPALSLTAGGTLSGASGTLTLTGGDFDWGGPSGAATSLSGLAITQTGGNLVVGAEAASWPGGSISTPSASIGATTLTETNAPTLTVTGVVTLAGVTVPTSATPGTITAAGITNTGTTSLLGSALHVEAGTNTLSGALTTESLTTDTGTTLTVTSPTALTAYAGSISGTITGSGTFTSGEATGTPTTTIGGSVSTAALDVVGGSLTVANAGSITATTLDETAGAVTVSAGASLSAPTVDVNAGTLTVDSGATYAAATATSIGTGTLDFADTTSTTGTLSMTGGELNGTAGTALTASGAFTWSAGTINSPAGDALAITTGAGDAISGTVTLDGGSLTTTSPVTLSTNVAGTGATISVGGVLAGAGTTSTYGFNTDALTLTGGTTTVAGPNTLASGALTIKGGTVQDDGKVGTTSTTLTGGTLDGTGTVDGTLTNSSGTVSPGDTVPGLGTLKTTGAYSQGGGGELAIELDGTTAGSGFSQLQVAGGVTLGGDLYLADGSGFVPAQVDTFAIVTATSTPTGALTLTGPGSGSYTYAVPSDTVTLSVNPTPGNAQPPQISGNLQVGQTLTCSSGNWSGNPPITYTYQWNRDGSPISGATSSTYVVLAADQGHALTCTVTATNAQGAGPAATSPAVSVAAPAPPPGAPVNTAAPAVSGTPTPGNKLSCSTGTWSGTPTGFSYQWDRNGTAIAGATLSTYTVQIGDEGSSLTCTVTASNAVGAGTPQTAGATVVALPGTLSCPKPTGRISGTVLGPLALGVTRAHARRTLKRYTSSGSSQDNFCLYGGWDIRVGYPSSKLLRSLSRKERARVNGRTVLILTMNVHYALNGALPGTKLTAVAKRLKLGKVIKIGSNDWYLVPGKASEGLLRVRGGIIQEVGIATKALTQGLAAQRRFLAAFNSA